MNIINYWYKLKNKELRYTDNNNLKRKYIKEVTIDNGNFQEKKHSFYIDDKLIKTFTSYCGYDRQIKKLNIINKMFNLMYQ